MAVLAIAAAVYWRSQVMSSSSEATTEVVISAGAPLPNDAAQAIPADLPAAPARAYSAELPPLESVASAAAFSATAGPKDDIGPAEVESSGAGAGPKTPAPQLPDPTLGDTYTWHDGDRTLQVRLDPNLTVQSDGDGISRDDIVADTGVGVVARGAASEDARSKGDPVFWSESGELMALPGGAVLVLDPSWDYSAVDAFFGRNGIDTGRLTELDFVTNGYFIETEPGLPSLDLANSLAGQDGVELSSPNWWIERVTK
ncbi:hypothetical protein [Candidatus Poriferisodalis sp.]|uniref:hypothetical protein n=1 Tax=Candidatus Poriferisodalis sp. TaxID=3101277 RepID=UPI003AF55EE1